MVCWMGLKRSAHRDRAFGPIDLPPPIFNVPEIPKQQLPGLVGDRQHRVLVPPMKEPKPHVIRRRFRGVECQQHLESGAER